MKILTGITLIGNVLLWIIGIIIAFQEGDGLVGFPALIGLIGFFVAYSISGGVATSPADYFFQPEWSVFKTKLKWSNSTGLITFVLAFILINAVFDGF